MNRHVFSWLKSLVRPRAAAGALLASAGPAIRGAAAPPPRSADSNGRLRRMRQLVEDNRLL